MLRAFAAIPKLTLWQALEFYEEFEHMGPSREERAMLGLIDRWWLLLRVCGRDDLLKHGVSGANETPGTEWLYARCREVEAEPDNRLDLWARFHYKSTFVTFGGLLQEILRDPEVTIGIFSDTNKTAKPFLTQIKREMEDNDELRALYPEVLWGDPKRQAPRWSEDKGIIVRRRRNPKEATVEAYGLIDGQPTGRHFSLVVYDDLVTDETVTTPERVEKVTQRWSTSAALRTRRGRQWYAGTRWAVGDTYEVIMERRAAVPRIYPATADGTVTGRPVMLTQDELDTKRREMGSEFGAQMLLNPAAGGAAMFMAQWLRPYEVRPRTLNVYITVDPSKGATGRSDRTAMIVTGVDAQGGKFFLDGLCHRMNLSERWIALRNLHKKWVRAPGIENVIVGYEQYGLTTDIEHFHTKMDTERYHFDIEEVSWSRDNKFSKEDRVGRLVPDIREGRFHFPLVLLDPALGRKVFWRVNERGQIEHHELRGETKLRALAIANKQEYRVVGPLATMDENARVYDVTDRLLVQIVHFPYAVSKDAVDALSRIYDLEPVPPLVVRPDDLSPKVYVDS